MKARGLSQRALEFRARRRKVGQCSADAVTGGSQLTGPWFNSASAAIYLDRPSRAAFRVWAKRHGVVAVKRAGLVLYAKADIDRVLGLQRKAS